MNDLDNTFQITEVTRLDDVLFKVFFFFVDEQAHKNTVMELRKYFTMMMMMILKGLLITGDPDQLFKVTWLIVGMLHL